MKNTTNSKTYTITPVVQNAFILLLVSHFIVSAIFIIYYVVQQWPTNRNLSGYLLISIHSVVLPLLFFLFSYLTQTKPMARRLKIFESLFYALFGLLFYALVQLLLNYFYVWTSTTRDTYWESVSSDLVAALIVFILYCACVVRFRTK